MSGPQQQLDSTPQQHRQQERGSAGTVREREGELVWASRATRNPPPSGSPSCIPISKL